MISTTKKLGDLGEKIATDYLKKKGYKILAKNYIPKWLGFDKKEIDIVTEKENIITFIEVKTLQLREAEEKGSESAEGHFPSRFAQDEPFLPEQKVNFLKQRKIKKAAESYLLEKKIPLEKKWQIDIISIKIDLNSKRAKLRHFKNAIGG